MSTLSFAAESIVPHRPNWRTENKAYREWGRKYPHLCRGKGANKLDISNHKFARLTALELLGKKGKERIWLCVCDCGKKCSVQQNNLKSGHTKSCGCLEAENRNKQTIDFGNLARKNGNEWYKYSIPANKARDWGSKQWRVRDPNGAVYEFKNLAKFLREHSHLFDSMDLRPRKLNDSSTCCAYVGIVLLRPTFKKIGAANTWKGWTWYSQTERLKNEGRDLLERNT